SVAATPVVPNAQVVGAVAVSVSPIARPNVPGSLGLNEVLVYAATAPRDDPDDFGTFDVACVRTRYIAPDFKLPVEGRVTLTPEDFVAPDAFDPEVHCRGLESAETP
ncbi:MAG: hypothetical protein AAFZ18_12795, partial [Myxococcota bacterium]